MSEKIVSVTTSTPIRPSALADKIKAVKTVTSYGAKGDGTTDDTAAFQAALAAERVLFVPGGTYKLSAGLVIRQNCCLELSQDTILNFTITSGNCIEMRSSATLRGNHAIINVPYTFTGHVIDANSTHETAKGVEPYTHWTPMWKHGRYIYDICIVKANSSGLHLSTNGKDCCGTGIYLSGDGNNEVRFIWGALLQGIRIGGAFTRGIHAINFDLEGKEDSAWNHDMRIEAVIHGCEIGVDLTNCNDVHLAVAVQPAAAEDKTPYAKWGVYLNDCRYIDMSSSVIWDWNATNSLYTPGGQYTTLAMFGNCCGLVYNDFGYYTTGTKTRDRIYTDTPSNLEKMTIMQEPIDAIFKVIDGVPHFANGSINEKLISDKDLAQYFQTDHVKGFTDVLATATGIDGSIYNGVGYKENVNISSIGNEVASNYYTSTGFIPCVSKDEIYVKGMSMTTDRAGSARIVFFDSEKKNLTVANRPNLIIDAVPSICKYRETENGCVFTVGTHTDLKTAAFARITVDCNCVDDSPMISINEEIKYTVEGFLADGVKVKSENVIGDITTGGKGIPYIVGNSADAGAWTGTYEGITAYAEGLTILYKTNVAGASGGTTLDINGLGAIPVYRNASTAVTTIYPVGTVLMLTYSEGAWLTADYDANTKTSSGTSNKVDTKMYLVGGTSQNSSGVTTYSNKNVYIGTDNELYSNGKKVAHDEEVVKTVNGTAPDENGNVTVETGGSSLLVVTFTTDENGNHTPSHTYDQIMEVINNGGSAVLTNGSVWYNLSNTLPSQIWFERTALSVNEGQYTRYVLTSANTLQSAVVKHQGVDVTTEVGQTIIVKEVDANGKPTKWESADYQPRTHWEEYAELSPSTTITPFYYEALGLPLGNMADFDIVIGNKYKVTFDGVEYECEAFMASMAGMSAPAFGNTLVAGGADTGYPFAIFKMDGDSWTTIIFFDMNPHTVKVEGNVVHKIPDKYVNVGLPFYVDLTVDWDGVNNGGFNSFVFDTTWDELFIAFKSGREMKLRVHTLKGGEEVGMVDVIYTMNMGGYSTNMAKYVFMFGKPYINDQGFLWHVFNQAPLPQLIPLTQLEDGSLGVFTFED